MKDGMLTLPACLLVHCIGSIVCFDGKTARLLLSSSQSYTRLAGHQKSIVSLRQKETTYEAADVSRKMRRRSQFYAMTMRFLSPTAILSLALLPAAVAFVAPQPEVFSRPSTELFAERKALITGNWKLNPQTKEEAAALGASIASSVSPYESPDVGIFVPYPFIETVQKAVDGKIFVGAEVSLPTWPFRRRLTWLSLFLDIRS